MVDGHTYVCLRQVAFADRLILNKTDLVDEKELQKVTERIRVRACSFCRHASPPLCVFRLCLRVPSVGVCTNEHMPFPPWRLLVVCDRARSYHSLLSLSAEISNV